MTTNTLTAPATEVAETAVAPVVYAQPAPRHPGHPLWDAKGVWESFIQTRFGQQTATLHQANVGRIRRTKNDGSRSSLAVARNDRDTLTECQRWMREVAQYRNGRLMFVGPITKRRRNTKDAARVFDTEWVGAYLNKRAVLADEAAVVNFFLNPRFDDGLANWIGRTPGGVESPSTATLDPTDSETGTQSAVLVAGQSLSQPLLFTAFHTAFTLEIAARVKIAALVDPGVLIGVTIPGVSATPKYTSASIEATTPRGVWTTVTCTIAVDGTTQPQIAVYPTFRGLTGGTIKVDHCTATIKNLKTLLADEYSLGDLLPDDTAPQLDMARIAANLINGAGNDLNVGVDAPITGQLAADEKGQPQIRWDALAKMIAADAFDIGEHITRYTRTIRTFHPAGGRDIDPDLFTLTAESVDGRPPTCTLIDDDEDSTDLVNDLFATGPEGIVGRAIDTAGMDGFALQGVRAAESGLTTQAQVDGWAATNLIKNPGEAAVVKAEGIDCKWLDLIDVMDRVWVYDPDGWPDPLDEYWEIVEIEIDQPTDTMAWTLNKPAAS